jgi:hypothetical protein
MAVPAVIAAIAPVVGKLIDRLVPDEHEAKRAKMEMQQALVHAANQINLAQAEINKTEAAHRSVFVAGWRPAIGWACSAGFAWAFVIQPLASWAVALWSPETELPEIDTLPLLEMTFAMLGLAGLRSWEKDKGLTK